MTSFLYSSTPYGPWLGDNASSCENHGGGGQDRSKHAALLCVYSTFIAVSLTSNIFSILVLGSSRGFSETERLLYQALRILDILTCSNNVVLYALKYTTCVSTLTFVVNGLAKFFYCQSLGILVNISFYQYILITRPLRHHRYLTRRTIILFQTCYGGTVLVACLSVPLTENRSAQCVPGVLIAIGLIIHAITMVQLLRLSLQQSQRVRDIHRIVVRNPALQQNRRDRQVLHNNRFKGIRTIAVISVTFWISTVPDLSLAILVPAIPQGLVPLSYRTFCGITSGLSTCWGPLILYLTNKPYREATHVFMQRLKRLKC